MEFVLTGFRQNNNVRQYSFQAIAADRTRSVVKIGADLSLMRKHNIPLQELPLLCRRLLEGSSEMPKTQGLMFTEQDMLGYAKDRASAELAAGLKRKKHRPPVSTNLGQAWRTGFSVGSPEGGTK